MDKNSWKKWISIEDSSKADTFRQKHERTFTKMIQIGERSG